MLNRRCMLTYDETCDPRLLAVIDQVPAELWGAKLALQLLDHRLMAASSPYAAYIAQLPVGVAGVPIFFSREAINALEYPPVTEQVKKRCSIAAGDALLISYGPLPNDFLLMDYGFLQPDNPHDRVQLRFDLDLIQVGVELARVYGPDQKPLELQPSRWQSRVLAQLGLQGPGANLEVTLGGSQLVDPRLVAATRVLLARSEAELQLG
ncbi:NADPH:adrenodoxin mitochondrial isoform X1 [Haematococcus lacustris]|uniref:NADPH:adrenodoxin mitochondrial isoform X1 n=1 Tax=Haematococcus lacustris TaxID=44745 RepID=A0A699ZQ62_HAELA|nr:NADPH:adrenodoxin mitochondrial isoform X1 [Haematococcus lacustris]